MRRDNTVSGLLGAGLVILAAGLWATVGVSVKLVPSAAIVPPELLGMARTLLAGPLILLVCLITGTGSMAAARSVGARRLMAFGVSGLVFQICLFRSFEVLGVTLTVALTVSLPPLIASLRSQLTGNRVGTGALAALGLALAGLIMCTAAQLAQGSEAGSLSGLGLAIVASVAFVFMTDAARSMAGIVPPIFVAGIGLSVTGLLFCLVAPFTVSDPARLIDAVVGDWRLSGLIAYLALVPTALAYICYCAGIARCRSAAVGLTASMIEPAIAALFAFFLFGEHLTLTETVGCMMMAASVVILVTAEAGSRRGNAVRLGGKVMPGFS